MIPASIRPSPRAPAANLAAAFVPACGLIWGLGLARALYERLPSGTAFLGLWPGALAMAALAATLAAGAWLAAARFGGAQRTGLAPAFLPLALPLAALLDPTVHPLRLTVLLVAGPVACLYVLGVTHYVSSVKDHASPFTFYALRVTHYAFRFAQYFPPVLTFLLPLLLYLRTLAPTVGEADTFEFQVDSLRLAVAHPSGYPLYILIGKLFSLLPLPGSPAYRINLSSAFFGALAGLGVYGVVTAVGQSGRYGAEGTKGIMGIAASGLTRGWMQMPALIAGLTFGLSFGLWSRAVEAEVYTLHAAFVSAILLVVLTMVGRRNDGQGVAGDETGVSRVKYKVSRITHYALRFTFYVVRAPIPLLFFLLGLSLTNHLTTALLMPAVAAALLFARRRLSWRTWLGATGLFALGLSVYLYIPIRWPAVNGGEVMSLAQFAGYVTGQQAQGALRLNAWLVDPGRYGVVGGKVLGEFGWVGVLLALAGLVWLLARRETRPMAAVLLVAYAAYFYFGLSFYVPDPDFSSFLLPAHLIQSVLIGVGIAAAAGGGWRMAGDGWRVTSDRWREGTDYALRITDYVLRFTPAAILTTALLLPLSLIWRNLARVDQSQDWGKYELGRYILSQPLAKGALLLADSQKIAPLYYLQVAEGARPDLTISVLPDEAAYRDALDEGIAAGRTVYLARYLPGLQGFFHLRSVGPVTEAGTAPLSAPPPAETPLDVTFGGAIRLLGANLDSATVPAGGPLRLTLFWQSVAPVERNYLVRLRLLDGAGRPAQETLGRLPANGYYPTNAWGPGEIVPDFYQVDVDAALVPGSYALQAGLFPPFSDEGLAVEGGADEAGGTWARIATIDVRPADRVPAIPIPVRFDYVGAKHPGEAPVNAESPAGASPLRFIGYDLPASAAPGSNVTASFFWVAGGGQSAGGQPQGVAPLGGEVRYALVAPDGAPVAAGSFDPAAWPKGAVIVTRLTFAAPTTPGALDLRLMVDSQAARCGWLRPLSPDCPLATVKIEGEAIAPGAVNFADKILLRSLSVDTPQAGPGEIVRVSADWQALAAIADDYTVFVHLIGPDGIVHGQVDTWPVQGTRPTSGWRPGERLRDTYEIRVPDDAPPGDYEVEVGWYLLETLERLPVLAEGGGAPVDDKVLREGLAIVAP